MAVSVISNLTSSKFYPANNHINMTVTSNNNGNCNFRYVCDIYINGVKITPPLKLFPDPTTGYGFFELSRVIQDYIDNSIPSTPYTSTFPSIGVTSPGPILTVYCKFGEEYDSSSECDGTVVQYLNQVTSNTCYVFNGAIDYEDYPTWNYTDYLVGTTYNPRTKFLTNSPREVELTYNDSFFLDFLSLQTINSSYSYRVTTYDALGGILGIFSLTCGSIAQSKRYRTAVGPYDINKAAGFPMIDSYVFKYDINLRYGSTIVSETFTFKVNEPKPFETRLAFFGLLGSIEHFTFYHRNKKSFDIDRKNYEKGLYSNTGGVWGYAVGARGTSTYKVSATEQHQVSTYCNQDISNWLYEMWLSPDVWTYKRPEMLNFRIFKDGNPAVDSLSDRMLFVMPDGHGLVAGNQIMCFPDRDNPLTLDYSNVFTITSVTGNIIDCGLTLGIYNLVTEACGWCYKVSNWNRLPISISDNNAEVKQKVSKPIEYSLKYQASYSKTTLRP